MGQTRIAEAFGQRLITIGVCTCAVLIDRLPDGRRYLSHLASDQRSAADIPDSALLINEPLTDNPNYIELAEQGKVELIQRHGPDAKVYSLDVVCEESKVYVITN